VVTSGFEAFEVVDRCDVFAGAPQQSKAAAYGTHGINFRARKAQAEPKR
jgi:hypothetical protein